MHIWRYFLRDAKEGIFRNKKASFGATLLIFLSLTLSGMGLLFHFTFGQVTTYLQTQMTVRVMLTSENETSSFLNRMENHPSIQQMTVESGKDTYLKLKQTLKGKEDMLQAFRPQEFPPTVIIEVKKGQSISKLIKDIEGINGVKHIFYPQQMAKILLSWTTSLQKYGWGFLSLFLLASFVTIHMTITLSFLQRKKEVKMKLLLGAKPKNIHAQFMIEGLILGGIGAILADALLTGFSMGILFPLEKHLSFITTFDFSILWYTRGIVLGIGWFIGILGSYFPTKKAIKNTS